MGHTTWLARLTILVWLSWLALLGLMFGMLRWNVWHPHFLPVTLTLLIMVVATLALSLLAVARLKVGFGRLDAPRWTLLGLPPLAFQAGYFMYGLHVGYGRQLDLNFPLRMLIPFGESMLDLAARVAYPVRTEGERVVMISAPLGDAQAGCRDGSPYSWSRGATRPVRHQPRALGTRAPRGVARKSTLRDLPGKLAR